MPSAVVTSKGRITIPKEVREALGVEAGDRVEFVETAKGVYEIVAVSKDVRELKGMIARPGKPVSVEDMRRAVGRRPPDKGGATPDPVGGSGGLL